MQLADRVVLLVGCRDEIARNVALVAAAEGASLLLADTESTAGHDIQEHVERSGGHAFCITLDPTDEDSVLAMTEGAMEIPDTAMSYGLGTTVRPDEHGEQYFHNGAVYGYTAWLGHRPDDGAVLAFASNGWLVEGSNMGPNWSAAATDRLWSALYTE